MPKSTTLGPRGRSLIDQALMRTHQPNRGGYSSEARMLTGGVTPGALSTADTVNSMSIPPPLP